jgi:hypothetical protein
MAYKKEIISKDKGNLKGIKGKCIFFRKGILFKGKGKWLL